MKKKIFIVALISALTVFFATAQSADNVTQMIATNEVTLGQFCYFPAVAMGFVEEDASSEQALTALREKGFVKSKNSAESPLHLSQAAYICVKLWNVKGSLMMKAFPSPRYAFRLLQAKGIVSPAADPSKKLTGHEALNLINACIEAYGDGMFAEAKVAEEKTEAEAVNAENEEDEDEASSRDAFVQE